MKIQHKLTKVSGKNEKLSKETHTHTQILLTTVTRQIFYKYEYLKLYIENTLST